MSNIDDSIKTGQPRPTPEDILRAESKPLDPDMAQAIEENFFECVAEAPPPSKLDEHAKWFERTIAGIAWLAWHLSSAYADESGDKRQDAFESLVQSQVNIYRSVWQHAEKHAREDSPKEVVPVK